MRPYKCVDGDMLDAICLAQMGSAAHVPAVLAANPGLADLGPVYAAGLTIWLPASAAPVQAGQVRLWGRT